MYKDIKCYYCNEEKLDFLQSEYELKKGGKISVCVVCENDAEIYLDKIKRECLIDGESLEITAADRKQIINEKALRQRREEEERVFKADKSIYYFSNEPLRKPELNYQVLKYVNEFTGANDDNEDHIQRFKFNYSIDKHWYLDEWDGLTGVNVYLDTVKKEYQKVRKDSSEKWRDRVRKWYSGRFECDESFYNVTFGFSQYDDGEYGDVYINYDFICSKSRKISELVEQLVKDGLN